jgi:hypothetical protein
MNTDMFVAGGIGIAPALALMYWTLKGYTYPAVEKPFFDDRKIFGLLAVGMVLGVGIFTVQQYFPLEMVLYALLFAVVYELVKLLVLNLKRFSRKLDTPFYGLVIGLGMGSTVAFGYAWSVILTLASAGEVPNLRDYAILVVLGVQLCLLNGSTGAVIGIGVTKGQSFGFFANAVLVHLAYNLVMIGFFLYPLEFWGYLCLAVGTVIVAYSYYRIHFQALPALVKEGISKYEARSKV